MVSGGMIYILSLMMIGSGIQVILRAILNSFRDHSFGITDERDL
jgi:hypothetical protein